MAAKGATAKENVTKIIADAFGSNFIGEFDKKVYVMANDGGEMVQIAISLTCPKTPIVVDNTVSVNAGDWDFSDEPKKNFTVAVANDAPAEITDQEKANIADLLNKLGL